MGKPLYKEKNKAIEMRLKGMSYSQIKAKLKVSKSSLSLWLAPYPLSPERIRELRDLNPRRIENCRNTKLRKKKEKLDLVYKKVARDIRKLSKRDLFIGGLLLYWGEGLKASNATVGLSNTDPAALRFFIQWLKIFNITKAQLSIVMHFYNDMNETKEIKFWMKELGLPKSCFKKSYIKRSNLSGLTYKSGFGHGTCNVRVYSKELHDYVLMGLKYIKDIQFSKNVVV